MNYPTLNFNKLKKREMLWLFSNKCKHGHRYTEHPMCFFDEKRDMDSPIKERIGFLDIETTNFKAAFGIVISWAILEKDGKLFSDKITRKEVVRESKSLLNTKVRADERILKSFSQTALTFDKLCVYWGKNRRHDVPYLRTRCIKLGIRFPIYGEVITVDVYDWARNFLSLSNYRLGTVCKEFGIPAKGHDMTPEHWIKATMGNEKAIEYIDIHCKEDVVALGGAYDLLEPFARLQRTSI